MFNLPAFLRQLIQPLRRMPLFNALARVLFGAATTNQDDLVKSRQDNIDTIKTTGQTAVLTDLLNRAVQAEGAGVIYIAETLSANSDFQVVVPPSLSDTGVETVRSLVEKYKLAGKRFEIVKGADYNVVDQGGILYFAFPPYIKSTDNLLRYAVSRNVTQHVTIRSGDTILLDRDEVFLGPTDELVRNI